ncbi:MAG: TetR/AcrR family transcriptional regulator [Hyphomicrobiaceae bacterium]|nr:TetR/AcrR family transcriptional regulator [Hyphomicrobiaceae bacterium]
MEQKRQAIFAAAVDLIEQGGLDAAKAREIAKKAGFAVGTLYNICDGCTAIIIEVNRRTLRLMEREMIASLERTAGRPGTDRIIDLAMTYLAFSENNTNRWRAVFEHRTADGMPMPEDYKADQARLFGLLEELLASEISDPAQRKSIARALFSAAHGIVYLSIEAKLDLYDREEARRQLEFLLKGLGGAIWPEKPKAKSRKA